MPIKLLFSFYVGELNHNETREITGAPEAKTLVHAKELALDFVEFSDLNPTEFFGRPLDEVVKNQDEIGKGH